MHAEPDGVGLRRHLKIEGERYYLLATRAEDGGVDFLVTCPDENKPTGLRARLSEEL